MATGVTCIKYLVFIFNFFFFLAGVGVMATGVYAQLKLQDFSELSSVRYLTGSILVIAAGASIAAVAFFGCCGSVKESRCLLCVYFVLLALVLAAEIGGAVLAYSSRDKIKSQLRQDLNSTLELYDSDGTIHKAFNLIQEKELCCGVDSYTDWQWTPFAKSGNNNTQKVPDTCCKSIAKDCGQRFAKADIHQEGCYDKLMVLAQDKLKLVGIVAIFIAAAEIIGLIFAFTLILKVGKSEYRQPPTSS